MENIKLSTEELNELIGGQAVDDFTIDVINNNSVSGCDCTYPNTSAIENKNSAFGCMCRCI